MGNSISIGSAEGQRMISTLFDNTPPVLVEVRFPKSGTSPDWYLCGAEEELEEIVGRLSPGVELFISSVWDLTNPKGALCLRKE